MINASCLRSIYLTNWGSFHVTFSCVELTFFMFLSQPETWELLSRKRNPKHKTSQDNLFNLHAHCRLLLPQKMKAEIVSKQSRNGTSKDTMTPPLAYLAKLNLLSSNEIKMQWLLIGNKNQKSLFTTTASKRQSNTFKSNQPCICAVIKPVVNSRVSFIVQSSG